MNLIKNFELFRIVFLRVGVLYCLCFILAPQVVDFGAINERVKVRRLNDYKPDFSAFVRYHQDDLPIRQKDSQSYIKYFDLVTQYVSDDPIGRYLLGFVQLVNNNHEKGVEYLLQVSNQTPFLFWPDYNLGIYFYNKGDYQQSASYLNKAINAPMNVAMKMMVESILYRQIFADKTFKSSLVKSMNEARQNTYILMLTTLDQLEAFGPMLTLSLKIISENPDQATAAIYYYAGIASFKLRDINKAVVLFEKSLALDDKKPWAYFWLAKIFDLAGNQEKAQEYIKAFKLLSLNQPAGLPFHENIRYRVF